MKQKKTWLLTALTLLLALALAGCGGQGAASAGGSSAGGAAAEETGFAFTIGGTRIVMGAEASPIVEALGEPADYFESESCAFEGLDKVYTYSGFRLNTYPSGDTDYVLSVVFLDDTVETEEGICIGSSLEEVTAAYGEPAAETDTSLEFQKGNTILTVGLTDGSVSALTIAAVVEG